MTAVKWRFVRHATPADYPEISSTQNFETETWNDQFRPLSRYMLTRVFQSLLKSQNPTTKISMVLIISLNGLKFRMHSACSLGKCLLNLAISPIFPVSESNYIGCNLNRLLMWNRPCLFIHGTKQLLSASDYWDFSYRLNRSLLP